MKCVKNKYKDTLLSQILEHNTEVTNGFIVPEYTEPKPVIEFKLIVRLSAPSSIKVSHAECELCFEPVGK